MNGDYGILSIHHRGYFEVGPPKNYVNGKVESVPVDGDYISMRGILSLIEADLGYPKEEIKNLFYKGPSEDFMDLTVLDGDDHIRYMVGIMKTEGEVEVFIDHGEFLVMEAGVEEGDENHFEEGDGPERLLVYGPNQVDGLECGSMVHGRNYGVSVEIEDPIQGNSFISGDEDAPIGVDDDAVASEDGEVNGPQANIEGNEANADLDLDDLSFELDGNDGSDLGSPNGSDGEHLQNVRNASDTIRRCTGGSVREKRSRARNVGETDGDEDMVRSKGKVYKGAEGGVPTGAAEYDRVSNGSTDIGSESDLENPGQLNEEEDWRKERWYDGNEKVPHLACGMYFKSKEEFKGAMADYAVKKCYGIYCKKGCNKKQRYKCKEGCEWVCYAAVQEDKKTWRVVTYSRKHNCCHDYNSGLATQGWIAEYLSKRIKAEPFYKIAELMKELKNELHLEPNKEKVIRAKKIILKQMVGNYKDEYAVLQGYANYLISENPNNTVKVFTARRNAATGTPLSFQGMYVSLDAMKKGWKAGCRPIIGLDGCHLKGICKGQLLVAVGRDAQDHVYPIAWQVVEVESNEAWASFISQLATDLDLGEGAGITFTSDRHKGLLKARRDILKDAAHRHCARHLFANWGRRHKGKAFRPIFWRCVNASFKECLDKAMKFLKEKTGPGYRELAELQGHNWTKAMFDENCKCDVPHNNICESFNSLILPARALPIISMNEWMYNWCLKQRGQLLEKALKWTTPLVPKAMQVIRVNSVLSRHCTVTPAGKGCSRVEDGLEGWVHKVDMTNMKCSCRLWQLNGIPCHHALACARNEGVKPEDMCSDYFRTERYILTYQDQLECTRGPEMWTSYSGEKIEAPVMLCKPGRPRKHRYRVRDEIKRVGKNKATLSRKGTKMTCSVCKSQEHRKRNCPEK